MGGLKKVYIHYLKWEDYTSGMWRKLDSNQESKFLKRAIEFTGNHIEYGKAMVEVSLNWPNTMLNSLTNVSINRRAFLGHCACSYKFNCPEYITRLAWKELTEKQRYLADKVAQQTINKWIVNYYEKSDKRIHKNMGKQMLLQWDS